MWSRQSFATPHSRVPSAMIGQYTLKPDTHSNRDTGYYAVRTRSQVNKQAKHTTFYKFEEGISFAKHWKLVAESSEFHLTLKTAHRVHFFQLEIRQKKRDILSEKRESGMGLKKREFTPVSSTVDSQTPMNLTLRPASSGFDQALECVCDLTQILAEGQTLDHWALSVHE